MASEFIAISLLFSFTQFKVTHLKHHVQSLTKEDPDIRFFHHNIPLTILSGAIRFFSVTWKAINEMGAKRDHQLFIFELALLMMVGGSLGALLFQKGWGIHFLHIYVVPYLFLGPFTFARFVAEHFEGVADDDYKLSRTCLSNSLCRWFWNNIQFHTLHHFYPTLPWYHLPKAHKVMEQHLTKNGAYIEKGYITVLWRAIKKYGFSLPHYWNFPNKESLNTRKRRPSLGALKMSV